MANEFDKLDLPAFTDCEIRSLKVLDAEIDRINNHYVMGCKWEGGQIFQFGAIWRGIDA